MNWALVDAATFDYAADAWGYTYGGAIPSCSTINQASILSVLRKDCALFHWPANRPQMAGLPVRRWTLRTCAGKACAI